MEEKNNQFFEDLDRLFVIIWGYLKRFKYILTPLTTIISKVSSAVLYWGNTMSNTTLSTREVVREIWYKCFPKYQMPFETIIDKHNVDHYLRISMESLVPDYLTGGLQTRTYIFQVNYNKRIKEIRYVPNQVIFMNIRDCDRLTTIPSKLPDGLQNLEIDSCFKLKEQFSE